PLVGNLPPDSNGMTSAVTSAPSALHNTAAITTAAVTAMVPIVVPSPNRPVSSTVTAAVTTIPVNGVDAGTTTPNAAPGVTVTVSPPALLDVAATWDDVQYYYQNGDWGEARWNLITMLSAKDGIRDLALNNISPALQAQQIYRELTGNPTALYWRQWLDAFTVDEISLTLADIYMGLANEDIVNASDLSTLSEQTADYLLAAAVGRPNGDTVRQLSAELSRYLLANEQQRVAQLDGLVNAYLVYANEREAQGAHCVSFQALTAAHQLAGDRVPSDLLRQYETTCRNVVTAQTTAPAENPLNGTIYYSSEQDGRYTIWRVPVTNPESVASVINNASQPSLLGNRLAFYSRRSDSEGLSGVELDHSVDPNERFPRYTNNVEDARESPARWNPTGTLLVFSSTDGDRKDRLYTTPTTFSRVKDVVIEGEDPVWSPDGKYILYRDVGADGNMPGLVLRSFDTGLSQRLTHGDDRRPIW
ncbi:MAG: PD40 domain-containing protein, partial [Caldilineaceae bacterium]|nr:PD40 domain-containing protein [Caldilineaceae bacterium]